MWYHLSLFYPADTSEPSHGGAAPTGLGAAYAKVASCTALAQVFGAPLAAAILAMDGLAGLRGWQWLFLLEGAATVVFGAALRIGLAPSPAKARMLSHAEREWLVERQAQAAARGAAGSAGAGREGGLMAAIKRPLGEHVGQALLHSIHGACQLERPLFVCKCAAPRPVGLSIASSWLQIVC